MGLFHAHRWKATSYNHLAWERGYPETLVLYVCEDCGRQRVDKLQGTWTPEQLGHSQRLPKQQSVQGAC